MAKSNASPIYKITIFARGPVTLEGTIESLEPKTSVTFRYRKPGSSLWAIRTVAWADLVSVSGEQGKKGSVTFLSPKQVVKVIKGTVESDGKLGLMNVTTEDGESFAIKAEFMEAIADKDIAVPAFYKAKAKKAASEEEAPKKKKKAA